MDSTAGGEQPEMDSLESTDVSTDEQPEQDSSEEEQTIEIDGEQVPISELKSGYMRTKDYTQKMQEIARLKKSEPQPAKQDPNIDPEVQKAAEVLKQAGFVTQEDIDKKLQEQKLIEDDNRKLESLLNANPALKRHEKAIRAMGAAYNTLAWEDVIAEGGFMEKNKIAKAKASRGSVKGSATPKDPSEKQKSVKDMTSEEYEAWKKENVNGSMF